VKPPGPSSLSIVIASRDRHEALRVTLEGVLPQAKVQPAEVMVVDDGSERRVQLPEAWPVHVIRTNGVGRSLARNMGARAASGELIVFIDDDITAHEGLLGAHRQAHVLGTPTLAVGAVHLPESVRATPFGRFRQQLEMSVVPHGQRPVPPNFCTAANMSIRRARFLELGGFSAEIQEGEDQDLALRHSSSGGTIAFLPEALAIHRDNAVDIRTYCARVERGAHDVVQFCRRHPGWRDNVERATVNGPLAVGREHPGRTALKLLKSGLSRPPLLAALFATIRVFERHAPEHALLDGLYRLAMGIHIQRGFRAGLRT
jgi:GT2 family glycosyltransferase